MRDDGKMLRAIVFVLSILVMSCVAAGCWAMSADQADQKQDSNSKASPPAKAAPASLTGCVDEQEGSYVLLSDRTMTPIASLEADGFPKETFAKHVGHKVTVRGTSNSQGALPVFKVRTIERVSETCAPQL
ncbi:MAG TPA: hypothetical protein VME43_22570 [Bryobacteraceae bacterium]|nr:hypothetical protein [Bryobacteraceae bacterium]